MAAFRTALAPPSSPADQADQADQPRRPAALEQPAVRDVLAWMRLLVDPHDAAAVVRALTRPPIELRQVELARVIQVARRRTLKSTPRVGGQAGKLDLVLGLAAATESPHVPPEARERVQRFLALHQRVAADHAALPPQTFLARLIQHVHAARPQLLGARPGEPSAHGDALEQLQQLAGEFLLGAPRAGVRELTQHLAQELPGALSRSLPAAPSPARQSEPPAVADELGQEPNANAHLNQQDPSEDQRRERELHATLALLRDELLDGVEHIGGRLGELRLDTELDVAHGVVRYLELVKVATLLQRPAGQSLQDALEDVNARLLAAATPLQRDILQTSPLDHTLLARSGADADARALVPREQHSLAPFLPRKGTGLALSASDIHTYRSCPLRYKYARVLRIPVEQTVHQRFGIVVHQTLERFHSDERQQSLEHMLALLDASWRRAALGQDQYEQQLHRKAVAALTRYHQRLAQHQSEPVWFERAFSFRIGPHHLRGRVDRIDRVGTGEHASYELIDYKTSRPKSAHELGQDVQLSLYALAARKDWGLDSTRQAYYYVLDDLIEPVPASAPDAQSLEHVVMDVGSGILAQQFHPTPSPRACSMCDYRIVCPASAG